ncbi:MAG: sulfatase family protein [Sphingomonas sp.]
MDKRQFLGTSLAALTSSVLPLGHAESTPRQPREKRRNLLILTVDDMDPSTMGYMGNRHGLTPNLDKLAQQSHIFVNNRGAAPICMPSRQAFMSGLVPHRNSPGGFTPMYEGTQTICSILHKEGWFCAASHKTEHMQPQTSFPWDYHVDANDRSVLDHDVAFRQAVAKAKAAGRPFFINCNVNDPHRPFYGSQPAAKKDHDDRGPYGIPRPVDPADVEVPPFLEDLPDVRLELSQYWNSVQRADIAIGRVLAALDESGEAGNTVVIFCNDHGMPFPFSKATGYDYGTRVPAMVRYPGMSAPQRFDTLASNVDIMPTALDLLGVAVPAKLDGRSWLPRMRGEKSEEPEFLFTSVNGVDNGTVYATRAVADHRYLLIYQPWSDGERRLKVDSTTGLTLAAMRRAGQADPKIAKRVKDYVYGVPVSFFDLEEDPGQRTNLIKAPRHRARIARMRDALVQEMVKTTDPQLDNIRTMIAGGKPVVAQPATLGRQYQMPVAPHGPPRPPGLA